MKLQFSATAQGIYRGEVSCGSVHGSAVWSMPDEGRDQAIATSPLPPEAWCTVTVGRVDSADAPLDQRRIVLSTPLFTGAKTLRLEDVGADSVFYPHPDGYKDRWEVEFRPSQGAQVTARFINAQGRVVATRSVRQSSSDFGRIRWDGTNDVGRRVPAGIYTVTLTAVNIDGAAASARVTATVAANLKVAPGRVGKVRAGMTKKRAMKTGLLRSNVRHRVPGVCTKIYPLQPKSPHEYDYQPFLKRGRVSEITVYNLKAAILPKGLTHRSTAGQVRRAYKGKVASGKALYGNNTLFVKSGRDHIAYIFRSQGKKLKSKDKLLLVAVSRGGRPVGMADDGC